MECFLLHLVDSAAVSKTITFPIYAAINSYFSPSLPLLDTNKPVYSFVLPKYLKKYTHSF